MEGRRLRAEGGEAMRGVKEKRKKTKGRWQRVSLQLQKKK
jgi:hypothetical protein